MIKKIPLLCLDLLLIFSAISFSFLIRFGSFSEITNLGIILVVFSTACTSIVVFYLLGFYNIVIRFMGHHALITILKGVTLSAIFFVLFCFIFDNQISRSVPIIYWFVVSVLLGGARLLIRAYSQVLIDSNVSTKVAIYGAGTSGRQLLSSMYHSRDVKTVFFIDDSSALCGSVINGVPIYKPSSLPEMVDKFHIDEIFLAVPSASGMRRRQIIKSLESLPIRVKTVPDFNALVSGEAKVEQVRDVDLGDLLCRDEIPPNLHFLAKCNTNKTVMVTGAGGSIGSELCRQIIKAKPKELILMDISEYSLYQVAREFENTPELTVIPLIGSVRDQARLEQIFSEFYVDTVYHAAAYKHVPMVEYNMAEGVANNVFGTLAAAKAAAKSKVKNFVLVSTDKAVRPTNIMGASKRMAELIIQACAEKYNSTNFCMVRFGNVLGSSGSVVPLFREQILSGGPVTVTHKDITRYFMTIPEAAQLVLQAGAMSKGGDVFVLDMGEPVKISYLAQRMIRLMGYTVKSDENPDGELLIEYTGLRPGEKLYEELLVGDNVSGTEHSKIMRAEEDFIKESILDRYLVQLSEACQNNDCNAMQKILTECVAGFTAKDGISDALWKRLQNNKNKKIPKVVEASFNK